MGVVAPFVFLGLILLMVPILLLPKHTFDKTHMDIKIDSPRTILIYGALFMLSVSLIVLRRNIMVTLIPTTAWVLIKDRELFKSLDLFLLGTFVCFFIFVDHINQFEWINSIIKALLSSDSRIFLSSVVLSQGMSNVPTAILLSAFVENPDALLLGVSVGGLGTLVASLANLIAYKFYAKNFPVGPYHRYFLKLNIILLFICTIVFFGVIQT